MAEDTPPQIVNAEDLEEIKQLSGDHWGGTYVPLTPSMRPRGGSLGVNRTTVPPGRVCVPFHHHRHEDEVFYVLSGRGVFRYGDEPLREVGPGDCISCPAGTGTAHQLANPFDEDLVYLAIGSHNPAEICVYPDNGKVLVRGIGIGKLEELPYMHGEPERPKILDLVDQQER